MHDLNQTQSIFIEIVGIAIASAAIYVYGFKREFIKKIKMMSKQEFESERFNDACKMQVVAAVLIILVLSYALIRTVFSI